MEKISFKKHLATVASIVLAISSFGTIFAKNQGTISAVDVNGFTYSENYMFPDETNVAGYTGEDEYLSIENVFGNKSIKSINSNSFLDNNTLLEVKVGEGIEIIQSFAFKNCSKLNKIFIPNSIKTIKEDAFLNLAEDFTIVGYVGSEAERYALNNDISFLLMGDLDANGKNTIIDLLKFKKFFLNLEVLEPKTEKIADMNMDGDLNILDMVGLINTVLKDEPNATVSASKTALANPDLKNLNSNGTYINEEVTGLVDFVSSSTSNVLLTKDQIGKNSVYSPISYYMALSAVTEFSNGNTKTELLNALHATDLEMLRKNNTNIFKGSYIDNDREYCLFANSVWFNNTNGMVYNQETIDNLANYYYASSFAEDFGDEATGPKIASWITENTGGKIKGIEVITNPDDVLKLVNTINFENKWVQKFTETKKDSFYKEDGSVVEADFMKKFIQQGKAVVNENYTKAYLEMEKGYKMTFVLPSESSSVAEILQNQDMLKGIISNQDTYKTAEVTYSVPKYDIKSKFDLLETASKLGIQDAITPSVADFRYVLKDTSVLPDIFISDIVQEATLKIDEEGCSAAAYTMVSMGTTSLPPEPELKVNLELNKPFIYYVTDSNNSTLFIGTVYNPVE